MSNTWLRSIAFSDRHDLGSDLELNLTPSTQSIIKNGRGVSKGVR